MKDNGGKIILMAIYKIQSILCWLAFRDTGYEIMKWDLDRKYNEAMDSLKFDIYPRKYGK